MIALDSSALIAILRKEDEGSAFQAVIAAAPAIIVGAPTLLEVKMVAIGRFGGADIEQSLTLFVPEGARVIAFDELHLSAATTAFHRYGKGRHRASLNFGDCMAYAVAKVAGCPLLYKGEDFAATDIRSALA